MIALNIDEFIDHAPWREQRSWVERTFCVLSIGIEIRARVVLILSHLEIRSKDTRDSIVQTINRY
jgi:hypothetical protein